MHHCCEEMNADLTYQCEVHEDRLQCPDALIDYFPRFDEYGIILYDSDSVTAPIHYCPWCGTKLPESKRELWFEKLTALGIDPLSDAIPAGFQDDSWWKHPQKFSH